MDFESQKLLICGRQARDRVIVAGFKPRRLARPVVFWQAISTKKACCWASIQKFGAKLFGPTD
jgi:hypothetical protein